MLDVKTWEPVTYRVGGKEIRFKVRRLNFTAAKEFRLTVARCGFDELVRALQRTLKAEAAITARALAIMRDALSIAGLTAPDVSPAAEDDERVKAFADALRAGGLPIPELPDDEAEALFAATREAEQSQTDATAAFFDRMPDDFVTDLFTKVKDVEGLTIDGDVRTNGADLLEVADQALTIFTMQAVTRFCRLSEAEKNDSPSPSTSAQEAETVDGRSTVPPADSADGPPLATATEIPIAAT